jgi:hypothetical protein
MYQENFLYLWIVPFKEGEDPSRMFAGEGPERHQ